MPEFITVDKTKIPIANDNRTSSSGKVYAYYRGFAPIGTDPKSGKTHLRSYRGKTPDEIKNAILEDRYSEGFRNISVGLPEDIKIHQLINHYTKSLFPRLAEGSIPAKEIYLSIIRQYAGDISLSSLDVSHLLILQSQLLYEEGISPGQINLAMGEFHRLIRFAQGENLPIGDPFPYLPTLPVKHKIYELPTMKQLYDFQNAVKSYGICGDLINANIYLGIRTGEVQALCREDLSDDLMLSVNKHIIRVRGQNGWHLKLVPNRKMNDTYSIACSDPAMESLRMALRKQADFRYKSDPENWNPSHFFFVDENGFPIKAARIYRVVKDAGRSVGIANLSPHSLRRVLAYNLFRKTGDIRTVQTQLGHVIPYSSALYILKNVSAKPAPFSIANHLERRIDHETEYYTP